MQKDEDVAFWIFAYGSLLWNPGFEPVRRETALLRDFHRSFCMWSIHYRGTEESPGLVLALDRAPGAACRGMALAVGVRESEAVLEALRARELVSSAYQEHWLEVHLNTGEAIEAVTYVVDPEHEQYCRALALEEQARIIASAIGRSGPNREYLHNTASHLRALGLADPDLDWLAEHVAKMPPG